MDSLHVSHQPKIFDRTVAAVYDRPLPNLTAVIDRRYKNLVKYAG